MINDRYQTIAQEAQAVIKVKDSKFIGETVRVATPEQVVEALENIRKREYAASHHCFAWLLGYQEDRKFKYSDDGEPSGTAGKPIFDVIVGREVINLLLVVTRYFGGTKLGTGGLVRAYGEAARRVMDKSGVKEEFLYHHYRLHVDFSLYDHLQRLLRQLEATVIDNRFADNVTLDIEIRRSRTGKLLEMFAELTRGKGTVEKLETD